MHIGLNHFHKRKVKSKAHKLSDRYEPLKRQLDNMAYVIGTMGAFIALPQVLKIWIDKSTIGVSLLTWGGYLMGTTFWSIYGVIHKDKPITIVNLIGAILQFFIVLGLLIYR
jgi:MtN3 and saliva related transmembrane protein